MVRDLYPGPKPPSAQERREELARERLGDRNAFLVIENNVHFHPDLAFGGFGLLVLTKPSARRGPGVYLMDRTTVQWVCAYEIDALPPEEWIQLHDWNGFATPVQLYKISDQAIAARWISGTGQSIPPGQWDL